MPTDTIPVPMTVPTPESTRVCLNPPPAPTMSRMPATGAKEAPVREAMPEADRPSESPSTTMA